MTHVLFVGGDAGGAEESAALRWLRAQRECVVATAAAATLQQALASGTPDLVWIHAGAATPALPPAAADALRRRVEGGCTLLLSLLATPLVTALGLEARPPNDQRAAAWRDEADELWDEAFRDWPDFPHVRGLQAWGTHPLFALLLALTLAQWKILNRGVDYA